MTNEERLEKIRLLLLTQHPAIASKFFPLNSSSCYHWFELERGQFMEVFTIRANNPALDPVVANSIRATIRSLEATQEPVLLSDSIDNGVENIIIYSNPLATTLFGCLVFTTGNDL